MLLIFVILFSDMGQCFRPVKTKNLENHFFTKHVKNTYSTRKNVSSFIDRLIKKNVQNKLLYKKYVFHF